jgi:hypothetical protein
MNKQKITDIFLTKEAFEQHSKRLREERAKQYGLTLEEWDAAVLNQTPISPIAIQQIHNQISGSMGS